MNKEFHYYLTYAIAKEGGFSRQDAQKIAYSSQYVDDNNTIYKLTTKDGKEYQNYISQTYDITKPVNKLLRIYCCFHFVPGNLAPSNQFRDGSDHLLLCKRDSDIARRMLKESLYTGNPYLIGIATHAYADTYSHQNYTGTNHGINSQGILGISYPSIGHSDVGKCPDIIDGKWVDERLKNPVVVDNESRFMNAALSILDLYSEYNQCEYNPIFLENMMKNSFLKNYKGRLDLYQSQYGMETYDRYKWVKSVLGGRGLYVKMRDAIKSKLWNILDHFVTIEQDIPLSFRELEKTEWYEFQSSIVRYQKRIIEEIKKRSEHRANLIENMNQW